MKHRPCSEEQQTLEDGVIQGVKHRRDQGHSGQQRMPRHPEDQSCAQAHENDPNVLNTVVREESFEIVFHQGIQDAENCRDDSHDEHQQTGPGGHSSQRIQENAGHSVDASLDHDAGKQSRNIARRHRMGRGQPDMEGNDTRFNAESHEEQNKRSGLLAAVELGGDGTEAANSALPLAWINRAKPSSKQPASMCAMTM